MNSSNTEHLCEKRPVVYYGWVVIGIGFVTLGIAFGVWYSFSVFFLTIIKDLGWSRGLGSSIFSVFLLCHALAGLLTGYLQDRFGPRVVIPFGASILALSLMVTSQSTRLWHFYIAYGVFAGASVGLLGFISHSVFLPNWFERKRGLAVGIAMSGGKILFGYLSDRLGRERANTLGGITAPAGMVSLIGSAFVIGPLPILFALFFGLGYGAGAPLLPSIVADIFIGKSFGLIFAVISIGGGAGGAVGAFLSGVLRDMTG
ncbi:MAG: MFS transporter, partial [Desulfobacterales bacterium]